MIDIAYMMEVTLHYMLVIFGLPVNLFNKLPDWGKSLVYLLIVTFSLLILKLVWKHKEDWKHKKWY